MDFPFQGRGLPAPKRTPKPTPITTAGRLLQLSRAPTFDALNIRPCGQLPRSMNALGYISGMNRQPQLPESIEPSAPLDGDEEFLGTLGPEHYIWPMREPAEAEAKTD